MTTTTKWVACGLVAIGLAAAPFVLVFARRQRRERELKDALLTLRFVLKQYKFDQQTAPESLEALVSTGYLKKIPRDPMTSQADWQVRQSSGNVDVHSTSNATSSEGTAYSQW